jgi:hypothetical protein
MLLAHTTTCTERGGEVEAIRDTLRTLEFTCVVCSEKIAKSEAVTLDSETSWGKVIAKIKGRQPQP